MYNQFASNSKFKIGTKIKVGGCSGLDSDKIGIVISHFNNNDGYLMYLKNERNWIPVSLEPKEYHPNFLKEYRTYLPFNRLIKL